MVATETNFTSGTEIVASPNAADAKRRRVSGGMPTTFFSGLSGPEDPILGLRDRYIADPHPSKLSVAVGAYRTEEGKPLVLECVREAEAALLAAGDNKEYLPVDGLRAAHEAAARLVLGDAYSDRVYSAQTLSGTGGLSLAARVVGAKTPGATVYVPAPTWPIHYDVFRAAGLEVASYRYYDASTCALDFGGLCADLEALPLGAAVVLHACAHNPTGADPTPEQWRAVGAIVQRRRLLPIFDVAYLGMGNRHGDIDDDACAALNSSARNSSARNSSAQFSDALAPSIPLRRYAMRHFASLGDVEMLIVLSFAKNMGLYGERVGALLAVCGDAPTAAALGSHVRCLIRAIYSSPPAHGARLVAAVLGDAARAAKWRAELATMAGRMHEMREALHAALVAEECPPPDGIAHASWAHVLTQKGMFTCSGLTAAHVDTLRDEHHVYMTRDGRISMASLSRPTCRQLAKAIKATLVAAASASAAARDSSSPAEASFKSTASSSHDELGPMTPKEAPPPKEATADATAGRASVDV